ncbi:hypothetical protein Nepgr_011601 [Nepenthes gracilis]|uniref:Uncharacterized protein n=1 Tax=Nepenthes gracilis TaxID=150966 RepID=A0AAD3SFF8_NEPGR|nr:hypothetical protein Nepgr_011601 [Nepenthes gracilis]
MVSASTGASCWSFLAEVLGMHGSWLVWQLGLQCGVDDAVLPGYLSHSVGENLDYGAPLQWSIAECMRFAAVRVLEELRLKISLLELPLCDLEVCC